MSVWEGVWFYYSTRDVLAPRLLCAAVVVIMHCMLITLEPQWTECEHNESAGSNCEDNTTFIFTLKEQRDASEPETCTVSGNLYELMAPIRWLKLHIQHALREESRRRITAFFLKPICEHKELRYACNAKWTVNYGSEKDSWVSKWVSIRLALHGSFISWLMHLSRGLTLHSLKCYSSKVA